LQLLLELHRSQLRMLRKLSLINEIQYGKA